MQMTAVRHIVLLVLLSCSAVGCQGRPMQGEPRIGIRFVAVEKGEEEVELSTSASVPRPVVELDRLVRAKKGDRVEGAFVEIDEDKGVAMVRLSGTVRDAIADIVADGKADPAKVTVSYTDPAGHERVDEVELIVIRDEPATAARPFPFKGRFQTKPFQVRLTGGLDLGLVKAVNFLGQDGYDAVHLQIERGQWKLMYNEDERDGGARQSHSGDDRRSGGDSEKRA